ncbi:MAG: GMC oxidoreductase [Nitrospinales bacterium]
MIIDLNQADSDFFKKQNYDVCICGGGVAGITLALNLSKKLNIILLEAGDLEYSDESQNNYEGKIIGENYFDLTQTRLRYFGGTSNHWGGWCRPLDSHDFEPKSHIEHSGWPIYRSDLDPYLQKAKSILDIPGRNSIESAGNNISSLESKDFKKAEFWFSPPTRLGIKYRKLIEDSKNISCVLNSNITDILLSENFSYVDLIKIRNYQGKSFGVNCLQFVLATGGIENPRIMLNCNGQMKNGLGNSHDLVGRFFMEHPHNVVGKAIFEDHIVRPKHSKQFFSPSKDLINKFKILNFGLRVYPSIIGEGDEQIYPIEFKEKIRNILCGISENISTSIYDEMCRDEALLMVASEQAPNPSSRITLGEEIDSFNMRQANLDWQFLDVDKRTIRLGVMEFAKSLATYGQGRAKIDDWLLSGEMKFPDHNKNKIGGNHHMGTTKMGSSPLNGVVNSNQQVFGIENFYIAGSSVFSTSGHANPTFTIVQMTLRLADFLNKKIS